MGLILNRYFSINLLLNLHINLLFIALGKQREEKDSREFTIYTRLTTIIDGKSIFKLGSINSSFYSLTRLCSSQPDSTLTMPSQQRLMMILQHIK